MSPSGFQRRMVLLGVLTLFAGIGCQSAGPAGSATRRIMLFNGQDLSGWKLFIQDSDVDVNGVWAVKNGVVHCAGQPRGYMRTLKAYQNYKLHVEWRWAETPTNSGVLVHASGQDQTWPVSIECQLKAGSAGDIVLFHGTGLTVDRVNKQDMTKRTVAISKKQPSSEKPAGQWNTYDIVCDADTMKLYVNGVLQNEGEHATIHSGWICLQSEGSPIEFRNIYLDPL